MKRPPNPARDAGSIAFELASQHPGAAWPCPECAASVKGSNLARHWSKVHAEGVGARGPWKGADHAVRLPAMVGMGALLASLLGVLWIAPQLAQLWLYAFILAFTLALAALILSVLGMLPAELRLEGDTLSVRYGLGLLSRRVSLPPRGLESGPLNEHRNRPGVQAAFDNSPGTDVHVGSYLRVVGARGVLTIASKHGTGFRSRWHASGWSRGAPRRRCDIVVGAQAMVAVEYALVASGALRVRDA